MIVVLEIHHQLSSSWRLHEVKVHFSTVVELVFTPISLMVLVFPEPETFSSYLFVLLLLFNSLSYHASFS